MSAASTIGTLYFGSYERLLIGVDIISPSSTETAKLKMTVGYAAHIGSIRSIGCSSNDESGGKQYLATGSTDESIKIYDLANRKEFGTLHSHSGTPQSLQFFKNKYLIVGSALPSADSSGSSTGLLSLYRCKDFEMLKEMKGHKAPVSALAVHPSGRLCLSLDTTGSLKMWDLSTAKCAYTAQIQNKKYATKMYGYDNVGMSIVWNRSKPGMCDEYAVVYPKHVDFYTTADSESVRRIDLEIVSKLASSPEQLAVNLRTMKFHCFQFFEGEFGLLGCDDGCLRVFTIGGAGKTRPVLLYSQKLHESRIKCIEVVCDSDGAYLLVSASSDGQVSIWSGLDGIAACASADSSTDLLKSLDQIQTGARLTCMDFYNNLKGNSDQVDASDPINGSETVTADDHVETSEPIQKSTKASHKKEVSSAVKLTNAQRKKKAKLDH